MTAAEQGRFCSKCQKCVTDFTGWTDSEIYNYISKNSGQRICGRFHITQLNRVINVPYQPHSRLYQYFAGLGLMLILAQAPAGRAFANPPKTAKVHKQIKDTAEHYPIQLTGTVYDEQHKPISFAVIQITDSDKLVAATVADSNGSFCLDIKQKKEYTITAKYPDSNIQKQMQYTIHNYIQHIDITINNYKQMQPVEREIIMGGISPERIEVMPVRNIPAMIDWGKLHQLQDPNLERFMMELWAHPPH